jgi:exonuclease VII small subunit
MGRLDAVIAQLESAAAELDDLAFDRLREAVADGELVRPHDDKRLMQARRAVEKAVAVLRQLEDASTDPSTDPST